MEQQKGFFASLFDLSFSEFITTKLIKVLFVLGIILFAIWTLVVIVSALAQSVAGGIIALILAPLLFLLWVIALRVWLELIVIIFRIEENTRSLRKDTEA